MAEKKLNIGLLGCGTIAQFAHLPAMARCSRVRLAAICEAAEDLRHRTMQRWEIPKAYPRFEDLLSDEKIDAVLIAVPDAFHVPMSRQALLAGKHVLVEKPLGVNARECRELLEVVRRTGLTLQVGSMKRHDPGMAYASRFVREHVGPVFSVSAVYRDSLFRPAMQTSTLDPPMISDVSLRPAVDPKADRQHYNLWTQGAHLFDSIRCLAGPITAVNSQVAQRDGNFTWHGTMELTSGGIGHFELICKACADWCERYEVFGETGNISASLSLPFYHRPAMVRAFDGKTRITSAPLGEHSNAYVNQLDAFAAAVLDGAPANPDVRDGLAAVRILEAVAESTSTRQRVIVPQDPEA